MCNKGYVCGVGHKRESTMDDVGYKKKQYNGVSGECHFLVCEA
jgi:hypothetical protein